MNITCTQENLHKALQLVGRIVGNRTNLPVLANVLLQTENGRLKISATDLEIGLTTRIGAKVDEEGALTVPCRAFAEFIGSASDETITLKNDGAVLKVSGKHTKATFRGIEAEEFPVIPSVDDTTHTVLPGPAFLQGMKQVAIAVAPDDTRPVLAGMLLRIRDKELRCAATDSYRLAEKVIKLDKAAASDEEAIVPSRSINELARIVSAISPDQVKMALQDNQILFSFSDTEFVSRVIDGKYPDYERIIPQTKSTTAILDNEAFKAVLRSATIFAREAANTVKLHFGPKAEVTISALAESLGDASTMVEAEIDGEEAESSFNVRYITDAVGALADDKIEFSLSGKLAPGLIQGTKSSDYRYVIMPLKTE